MIVSIKKVVGKWYFDQVRLQRRVWYANRRALNRAGAIIRRRARQSIKFRKDPRRTKAKRRGRKRKRVRSGPGDVPFSHVRPGIKRIFFATENNPQAVVVGAVPFPSQMGSPSILESGGVTTFKSRKDGKQDRVRKRQAARPFMKPALANARPDLPRLWSNVL